MERLTVEDRLMLWPDAIWPQEVGALAVLDGGQLLDPDGRLRLDAARAAIGARLHLVPRFRQVLLVPRRGLGGPLWIDAPRFDIADHVRVAAVDPPGDEAALLGAVERLRRVRLDRSRPLWQICFLTGLPDDRIGLFLRVHHALADGMAAVATFGAFLAVDPDAGTGAPVPPWVPRRTPTAWDLVVDNFGGRAAAVGRALAAPGRSVRALGQAARGLGELARLAARPPAPRTSLDRTVGPDRVLAVVRMRLDDVGAAAHRNGATVNDVLLTLTAGGLRALLRGRGEPVDDLALPVYVPVTLRSRRDAARGNLIGQMVVPLPLGVADPARALRRIAAETAHRKAARHPPLGTMLRGRLARLALLKLLDRQPVSVTTADLPGPRQPLHVAGARLLAVYPLLPLIGNVPLGVGALSYAGNLSVMVVADRDAVPDLDVFVAGARDALRALSIAIVPPPVPDGSHVPTQPATDGRGARV